MRQVEIGDVPSLRFSDTYTKPVRGVRVREPWREHSRQGKECKTQQKEQTWIWVVAGDLDGDDGAAVRDWGHLRWKIALGTATAPLYSPRLQLGGPSVGSGAW